MIKVGLTGSIGMGKSTAAEMFADLGAMTWCADDAVHRMYEKGGAAVAPLMELFPQAIIDGAVDRARLAASALRAPDKLKELEAVVHPLVAADREAFLTVAADAAAEMVILDIPLLFENDLENLFDVVVVVSAPADVQRARALSRTGMNVEKLNAILAQQMPDWEKRLKADYVISTNQPLEKTREMVAKTCALIRARAQLD